MYIFTSTTTAMFDSKGHGSLNSFRCAEWYRAAICSYFRLPILPSDLWAGLTTRGTWTTAVSTNQYLAVVHLNFLILDIFNSIFDYSNNGALHPPLISPLF